MSFLPNIINPPAIIRFVREEQRESTAAISYLYRYWAYREYELARRVGDLKFYARDIVDVMEMIETEIYIHLPLTEESLARVRQKTGELLLKLNLRLEEVVRYASCALKEPDEYLKGREDVVELTRELLYLYKAKKDLRLIELLKQAHELYKERDMNDISLVVKFNQTSRVWGIDERLKEG